jgi:hypothetical protein
MSTEENAVVVFLLVYSGQPDPSWPLDENGIGNVVERVRQAQGAPADGKPPEPVLGYRGFQIENGAGVPELPTLLTVWRGFVIAADRQGRTQTWSDVGDLERWLLEDARRRDYGELLQAAGAPGGPRPQSG